MYAVIKTGGKQYRVAAGDKIQIEKLEGNPGDQVKFAEVLMIANGDAINIGAPHVAGATVVGVCSARNAELVRSLGAHDVIDYAAAR